MSNGLSSAQFSRVSKASGKISYIYWPWTEVQLRVQASSQAVPVSGVHHGTFWGRILVRNTQAPAPWPHPILLRLAPPSATRDTEGQTARAPFALRVPHVCSRPATFILRVCIPNSSLADTQQCRPCVVPRPWNWLPVCPRPWGYLTGPRERSSPMPSSILLCPRSLALSQHQDLRQPS